jgi:hypothetical protein
LLPALPNKPELTNINVRHGLDGWLSRWGSGAERQAKRDALQRPPMERPAGLGALGLEGGRKGELALGRALKYII